MCAGVCAHVCAHVHLNGQMLWHLEGMHACVCVFACVCVQELMYYTPERSASPDHTSYYELDPTAFI